MSSTRCRALSGWYGENARDLPWRHTRVPYRIWISEIMLQQTQVKTVLPRYAQWFERFPTIASLAAAPLDDVLKAWEGLGYYRRARFIHQAAERIVVEFGGQFPRSFDDILSLPGIGRSTAGAIASFCFARSTPVLDGNVKRVLRRWYGQTDAADTALWLLAQQAIDTSGDPPIWNQAMMELGATVCTAVTMHCDTCPVSAYCISAYQAVAAGKKKAVAVRDVYWRIDLHTCPDKGIWLTRRPDQGIWAGLWTPPITVLNDTPGKTPCYTHLLTHRRLHLYGEAQACSPSGGGKWVNDISRLALPTGIHRLLEKHNLGKKEEAS